MSDEYESGLPDDEIGGDEEIGSDGAPSLPALDRKQEIEAMMSDTMGPYWRGPHAQALQDEYRGLLEGKEATPRTASEVIPTVATDPRLVTVEGEETPSLETARGWGLDEDSAVESVNAAMMILDQVPEPLREDLNSVVSGLSDNSRSAIIAELGSQEPVEPEDITEKDLATLTAKGCSRLLAEWGNGASRRAGIAIARIERVLAGLGEDARAELNHTIDTMSGQELSAVLSVLSQGKVR